MKRIARNLLGGWTAAALAVGCLATQAGGYGPPPLTFTFEKCLDPDTGFYLGTVAGDGGAGTVAYRGLVFNAGEALVELVGTYSVNTPHYCFTALCAGQVDLATGAILLNGEVLPGSVDFVGGQVQVVAQLLGGPLGPGTCSEGAITVSRRPPKEGRDVMELGFEKSLATPGPAPYVASFAGAVSGDVNGCLKTRTIRRVQNSQGELEVQAKYEIYGTPDCSEGVEPLMVLLISGKSATTHFVLKGQVIKGWLLGANVEVQMDPVPCAPGKVSCFAGSIRIVPAGKGGTP